MLTTILVAAKTAVVVAARYYMASTIVNETAKATVKFATETYPTTIKQRQEEAMEAGRNAED